MYTTADANIHFQDGARVPRKEEVTPTAVKVAQLREDNDRWTLTKFSYRNVDNGSEELLRTNPEIYVEQIQTALQIAKVDTTNAAIALPVVM